MISKAVFDAGFSAAGPTHEFFRMVLKERVCSSPGVYEQGKKNIYICINNTNNNNKGLHLLTEDRASNCTKSFTPC